MSLGISGFTGIASGIISSLGTVGRGGLGVGLSAGMTGIASGRSVGVSVRPWGGAGIAGFPDSASSSSTMIAKV